MNADAVAGHVVGVVALITLVSAGLGALVRRVYQPTVVGQLLTGLLLCPAVLGALPADPSGLLFPAEILPQLKVLADVAVVVFMFIVGYELDLRTLRGRDGGTVLALAGACLLVPMALGAGTVLLLPGAFTAVGEPDPQPARSCCSSRSRCRSPRCRCWRRSSASGASPGRVPAYWRSPSPGCWTCSSG